MLSLRVERIADPDGHRPALALRGDWVFVIVSDGRTQGIGEASHSGDDGACRATCQKLFERHVRSLEPALEAIDALARGPFQHAATFVEATAISALDQALHDLVARREGVPVHQLGHGAMPRSSVPVYVTLNRALRSREDDDYRRAVRDAVALGATRVKVAPFEAIAPGADPRQAAGRGVHVLRLLREEFPDVGLRVDFHERLCPAFAQDLVADLEPLGLEWLEAPCPAGPAYAQIRARTTTRLAAGELEFGVEPFARLARNGWVDVVMPDVKHVGGFGPLLRVSEAVRPYGVSVSPHNPSGAVSTLASLHAAALVARECELEIPLHSDGRRPVYASLLERGAMRVPAGPGWGLTIDELVIPPREDRTK